MLIVMRRLFLLAALLFVPAALAGQIQKEEIDGIRNFSKVDATVACAGATEVRAIPELARRGYKSVLNLRVATEEGAAIEESRDAAAKAGLRFIHLPFATAEPDPKVVDRFLTLVTDPANQPMFINCGSANRVAAVWLVKRMLVDKWDEPKALEEAKAIGLRTEALQAFALDYVARHRR